ncbi:MAG: hypothetical protein GY854_21720 [Deltaproteobacteria bacterium]|nr:hypothetical protein [Deltaproteobacteria bacterium]
MHRTAATIAIRNRLVVVHETNDGITVAVYDRDDTETPIDFLAVDWAWNDEPDDSREEIHSETDGVFSALEADPKEDEQCHPHI